MNRLGKRIRTFLASFLRSRDAGAMLVSGGMGITLLAGVGGLMADYAWREAQWEELRSAIRASVSAAGSLLGSTDAETIAAVESRVGAFLPGLLPGMSVDDVTVAHDADTNVTTVTVEGEYTFQTLLRADGDVEEVDESLQVSLDVDKYEVAVALDVTQSMQYSLYAPPPAPRISKLTALKNAMHSVFQVVDQAAANDPGSIMVSLVPFAVGVNAADTCNPDPDTGVCRAARSEGKLRYVRMLAGVAETTSALLSAARAQSGHWVDTFHHYGAGSNLGPFRERKLPANLLNNQDWNLRRTNVEIDVSAQAPNLDTGAGKGIWVVDDEDFWNGCLMARWGAYWDTAARPAGWTADDTDNWPATKAVAAWTPASTALGSDTPLHLSDAPPDASDPNTRFTAYSWPDARIGMTADHRLQGVMYELLGDAGGLHGSTLRSASQGDNDWSFTSDVDRGGAGMCPPNAITPLTGNTAVLRAAIDDLVTVEGHGTREGFFGTYMHPGVVWALRSVSPLWRGVWNIDESVGVRPATPCAPGETARGCRRDLHKSILLVSDGANFFGNIPRRQVEPRGSTNSNLYHRSSAVSCHSGFSPNYVAANRAASETDFNAHFASYTTSDGKFDPTKMAPVLDAFHNQGDSLANTAARRSLREAVLKEATPWEIFRGHDAVGSIDALLDDANEFGFTGRPVQVHHLCGWSSLFGPYGRIDDAVRVGDSGGVSPELLEPVRGEAPFTVDFETAEGYWQERNLARTLVRRLDGWLRDACDVAGKRRVRISAIYIGDAAENSPERTLLGTVWRGQGRPGPGCAHHANGARAARHLRRHLHHPAQPPVPGLRIRDGFPRPESRLTLRSGPVGPGSAATVALPPYPAVRAVHRIVRQAFGDGRLVGRRGWAPFGAYLGTPRILLNASEGAAHRHPAEPQVRRLVRDQQEDRLFVAGHDAHEVVGFVRRGLDFLDETLVARIAAHRSPELLVHLPSKVIRPSRGERLHRSGRREFVRGNGHGERQPCSQVDQAQPRAPSTSSMISSQISCSLMRMTPGSSLR